MSHVLDPEYYEKNVGPRGKKLVEALIAVVRDPTPSSSSRTIT
jgi:hypothetical protein